MDTMPHMATVGTGSVDSIAADSANTMSAYTTGHKSSVNALGVYADRTPDPFDDPRQETLGGNSAAHGQKISGRGFGRGAGGTPHQPLWWPTPANGQKKRPL